MFGETANQRDVLRPDGDQAFRQIIDVVRCPLHELPADTIVMRRMFHDQRREGAEIAWCSIHNPLKDSMRVLIEPCEHYAQERRPIDSAVISPEHMAQGFVAEPRAAAFVGDRPAPAADAMVQPLAFRPADAAGANNDDAAIVPAMRADTGGMRIGGDDRAANRMRLILRGGEIFRLTGAGQRQASGDARGILA
jgi:hypothetical protein